MSEKRLCGFSVTGCFQLDRDAMALVPSVSRPAWSSACAATRRLHRRLARLDGTQRVIWPGHRGFVRAADERQAKAPASIVRLSLLLLAKPIQPRDGALEHRPALLSH